MYIYKIHLITITIFVTPEEIEKEERFVGLHNHNIDNTRETMGGCFSDIKGGKQAVIEGGTQQVGHNDAVDLFFKTKGLDALFTQIQVLP